MLYFSKDAQAISLITGKNGDLRKNPLIDILSWTTMNGHFSLNDQNFSNKYFYTKYSVKIFYSNSFVFVSVSIR
jgi:hypothetical protein